MAIRVVLITGFLLCALEAGAGEIDPRVLLYDGEDGATCAYFNAGALLPWRRPAGDWVDAAARVHGDIAFAKAEVSSPSARRGTQWDITDLARSWSTASGGVAGLMLVSMPPVREADFSSREFADASARPRLHVEFDESPEQIDLAPIADTELNCTTARSLGTRDTMRVGPEQHIALQFDTRPLRGRAIARATLVMTPVFVGKYAATVGVLELLPPKINESRESPRGIAAKYRRDAGIASDRDVFFAEEFESPAWVAGWTLLTPESHVQRVASDPPLRFEPLSGYALRVTVAKGDNLGLDLRFDFKERLGYEPTEVYFRYYLRLADDWNPTVDGGKLPGLASTYGRVGWGGRKSEGEGWSMRGQFNLAPSAGNPLAGHATIGTYAYHADMKDKFGDHWYWSANGLGVLERNRWYCIEQRFKVNTIGAKDGIFQGWVDDRLAFEKLDIAARTSPDVRVERVWMNVYHGGVEPAARDMHLYLDNVVVARKPIGCRAP